MPSYSIQAPNGKTYTIEGPAGASEDDVRAEVLRRDPSAGSAPAAKAPPKTLGDTLLRAAQNLPGDTVDTVKGALKSLPGMIDNAVHPQNMVPAATSVVDNIANVLSGGMQHVRELSAPEFQGSAPKMDTSAFDKFASGFTKQNAYKTISEHPAGAALAAASVAVPALRALGVDDAVAAAAGGIKGPVADAMAPVAAKVKAVTNAKRNAMATSNAMRAEATDTYSASQAAAEAQAAADADKAKRAAALAQRAKARQLALTGRQAEAAKAAVLPEPDVGAPANLSDLGDQVRKPALAKQAEIENDMRAADAQHRAALEAVAKDRASSGVGVSDTDAAKALISKSEALVSPDPVTSPDVGPRLAAKAGANLHSELLDTLKPQPLPLSKTDAVKAKAAGVTVYKNPDGTFYRLQKPDLKTVDDFRRHVGQVLDGKAEGYNTIQQAQAREMYDGLKQAIDEYSQGASKPVLENWKKGKEALEPFERVRAGQVLVGTQRGTDVASVPAANVPGRILAGGRDTIQQAAAVAGKEPVAAAVRSQVQNALSGAKGSDAINRLIAPGTKIGDAMGTDPDLASAVQDYLKRTKDAELQGAAAEDLGVRANTNASRAKRLDAIANTLQGSSEKAAATAGGYAREIANLEIADPKQVGKLYSQMLERAHKEGAIDIAKYSEGQKLAASAEKDFALKATRDKWLRRAGATIGIASAPQAYHTVTSRFGN